MFIGKEAFNEFYKNHEDPWYLGFSEFQQYRYQLYIKMLLRFIPKDKSLLDIGCGKGYFLKKLCKINYFSSLTGVDISEVAIEQAKRICASYPSSFDVQELPNITYNGKQFDVVLALEVVYYFNYYQERKTAIKNVFDLVKDNGYALISISIYDGWALLYNNKKESCAYELEIQSLLQEIGFEIVEAQILKDTWFIKLYKKICCYYDQCKEYQKKAVLMYPFIFVAKYIARFLISSSLFVKMGMFFNSFSSEKPSLIFFLLKKPSKV